MKKSNRLTYALPLACLLATTAFSRLAAAEDAQAADDTHYGTKPGGAAATDQGYDTTKDATRTGRSMDRDRSGMKHSESRSESSSGSPMADAAITAKVKSALLAERGLPSSQIKVETNDGVVQLSGFLNSQAEIDRAVSVAQNVKDVKSVENNMQTK